MEQLNGFNLFRVNCLLNDSKSTNFNSIILSVIYEYFFEAKNVPKSFNDIYGYIKDYLKIPIDFDFLKNIIAISDNFDIDPVVEASAVKLKTNKFRRPGSWHTKRQD